MRAQPHSSSAVHHHGNQDTIVYAVSGHGAIVSDGGKQRDELKPGDWAIIPKGREHQEVNEGDEEVSGMLRLWDVADGSTGCVGDKPCPWGYA